MSRIQTHDSVLARLSDDYNPAKVEGWLYDAKPTETQVTYRRGTAYFDDLQSGISELNRRNHREAQGVLVSKTGNTINNGNGLHVGVLYGDSLKERQEQGKFRLPTNLAQSESGVLPALASEYPRVLLPGDRKSEYAVLVAYDEGIFGTRLEHFRDIRIPIDTNFNQIHLPAELPGHDAVRQALAEFHGKNVSSTCPAGIYTVGVEYERYPVYCVRVDGGLATSLKLAVDPETPLERPISDVGGSFNFYKILDDSAPAPQPNPFMRFSGKEKYIEVTLGGDGTSPGQWASFSTASLEFQGRREEATLVYVPLARRDSVAAAKSNPFTGLVEVQIDSGINFSRLDIDYKPQAIQNPRPRGNRLGDALRHLSDGPIHTRDSLRAPIFERGSDATFSLGRTELAEPRSAPVRPKIQNPIWGGHMTTFRFLLANLG